MPLSTAIAWISRTLFCGALFVGGIAQAQTSGGSLGVVTTGSLNLTGGSILDYKFNGTANDFTSVTTSGGLTLDGGGLNLYQDGTTTAFDTAGVYDLIDYTGGDTGSVSDLSVLNEQAGLTYTFVDTGSLIQLDIVAVPELGTWALMLGGLGLLFIMQARRRCNS